MVLGVDAMTGKWIEAAGILNEVVEARVIYGDAPKEVFCLRWCSNER